MTNEINLTKKRKFDIVFKPNTRSKSSARLKVRDGQLIQASITNYEDGTCFVNDIDILDLKPIESKCIQSAGKRYKPRECDHKKYTDGFLYTSSNCMNNTRIERYSNGFVKSVYINTDIIMPLDLSNKNVDKCRVSSRYYGTYRGHSYVVIFDGYYEDYKRNYYIEKPKMKELITLNKSILAFYNPNNYSIYEIYHIPTKYVNELNFTLTDEIINDIVSESPTYNCLRDRNTKNYLVLNPYGYYLNDEIVNTKEYTFTAIDYGCELGKRACWSIQYAPSYFNSIINDDITDIDIQYTTGLNTTGFNATFKSNKYFYNVLMSGTTDCYEISVYSRIGNIKREKMLYIPKNWYNTIKANLFSSIATSSATSHPDPYIVNKIINFASTMICLHNEYKHVSIEHAKD